MRFFIPNPTVILDLTLILRFLPLTLILEVVVWPGYSLRYGTGRVGYTARTGVCEGTPRPLTASRG